jgi:alpha-tubulin suppressor-like RCC1 family protein
MSFKVLKALFMIFIVISMAVLSGCDVSQTEMNGMPQASIEELEKGVGAGSKVIAVSGGYLFSMAIVQDSKNNKTLWVIGNNDNGQLGLGDTRMRVTWQNTGLKNVTLVACGYDYSICVSNNYLWVTGSNGDAQLGLGHCDMVKTWTKTVYGNIQKIACGFAHSMFISGGCLWVAGDNTWGQLGFNPVDHIRIATWTQTQNNYITDIACGTFHSLYVGDNKKSLYATGMNDHGELGLGYIGESITQWSFVPNIYDNVSSIESIACGSEHSIMAATGPLLSYPSLTSTWLWVTGSNGMGQIGFPSYTPYVSSWQQLPYGISNVACGNNHSMFTSNGSLWVTGINNLGQLGLGDYNTRYGWEPTIYGGIPNSKYAIAGGYVHSLFISNNQTWGAGSNYRRELGVIGFTGADSPWFLQN